MKQRKLGLGVWVMSAMVCAGGCFSASQKPDANAGGSADTEALPRQAAAEYAAVPEAESASTTGAEMKQKAADAPPAVTQSSPVAAPAADVAGTLYEAQAARAVSKRSAGKPHLQRSLGAALAPAAPRPAPTSKGMVTLADRQPSEFNTEGYAATEESHFVRAKDAPLSTFSIDVDTASYSNVRRFLNQGTLPPSGAVRIEELVNYFPFDYPNPSGDAPCSLTTEISEAPWNAQHRLLHVGLQARRVDRAALPPQNLVFLLDVSGSMSDPNKLPLLKRSLATLADTLRPSDKVAIVVYAGASGLVLPPTSGGDVATILSSLERLEAGGSTNGGDGIELAYAVAERMAAPGAINRVILATDGDFNVGVSSQSELVRLIEAKRTSGVFLSVLGFGMGNLKDSTLELLADKGNGNYAYIDSLSEARKVLVSEAGGTLMTLAKDVKIQIEFNPQQVAAYRLIGYDNRRLAAEDFNDDAKDAGELGAGHSVTALYELVPPGVALNTPGVDPLKYQTVQAQGTHTGELATLKLRYKAPSSEKSQLLQQAIQDRVLPLGSTSNAFRFSAAVASFGMTLRDSSDRGRASFALARQLASGSLGADSHGYGREFIALVDAASRLKQAPGAVTIGRSE